MPSVVMFFCRVLRVGRDLCHFQISKFCILRMPEFRKLLFCTWNRTPHCSRPVNSILVVLVVCSQTVTRKRLNKLLKAFSKKFPGVKGSQKLLLTD